MEKKSAINNAFYEELKQKWDEADDHPIALLRAENGLRNPWIEQILREKFKGRPCSVLDVGCGAGFLTHFLARHGHTVYGIDLSQQSLNIAKAKDRAGSYTCASAYELPFPDKQFDAVCAMDLLEHVEEPAQVVKEACRVLKTGGLFFFHTFNRNAISYFFVIKGVEWCFSNAPENMHLYSLFLKPKQLQQMCQNHSLRVETILGVCPKICTPSFWKMVLLQKVDAKFRFRFTRSLLTGYSGYATKI
jgi:2-polyprenyl-6-hydroxyphenyl methylase/3-demethylubiquinone-9 3-methyltransferase